VVVDKQAETLFEKKSEELLKENLFELMIPYSKLYLQKTMGESIFNSLSTQSKTFSYTIYSETAYKRYRKAIINLKKKDEDERRRLLDRKRITEEEKNLMVDENSIYYKYLKAVTSRASLIELRFSSYQDIANLEKTEGVKVKMDHFVFQSCKDGVEDVQSYPAILLISRKAHHIQKFNYEFMKDFDQHIILRERKYVLLCLAYFLRENSEKIGQVQEFFYFKKVQGHTQEKLQFGQWVN